MSRVADAAREIRTDRYSFVGTNRTALLNDPLPEQVFIYPLRDGHVELPRGITVGSARPMEDAARIAWVELIDWLGADYGFDGLEAYQLLTHAGRLRVGNMVDPLYSVVAKIDRRYLPDRKDD